MQMQIMVGDGGRRGGRGGGGWTKTKTIQLTGYVSVNSTSINILGALKMMELIQKLYSPRLIIVF